jgi:hypothetical protein
VHTFRDSVADARARRAYSLAQFDEDGVRIQFGVALQIAHIAQPFTRAERRGEAGRRVAARVIANPGNEGKMCGVGRGGGAGKVEGGNINQKLKVARRFKRQTYVRMLSKYHAHDFCQPIEKGATVHGGVYDTERAAKGEVTMISGFGFWRFNKNANG